ncbi:LysR family transcriptional regulator [Parvibaculum sp.]|uniref:LysR family transcriptional regulator n=1 Tax=Parvibaculum sp. TaxID=2024848 RepID=UPI0025CDAF18|nr:LysR family transcriptional regulator [Parvibaculum sp.]
MFVEVAERGSFVKAAAHLGRSTAAVSRAVAALEARLDTRLLLRTTRAVTLTDAGTRYLDRCRTLLAGFEELEAAAASEQAEPQGLISLTAPVVFGRLHVLPVAAAFLGEHPRLRMRFLMLDRNVSLVDEGIDVGVRIGPLADSSLKAAKVGRVTRGIYASPAYLARAGTPETPEELGHRDCIAVSAATGENERWAFGARGRPRKTVAVTPRLTVTTIDAGIEAALAGLGLARLLSYQVDALVAAGKLTRVLAAHEPDALPIHVIQPASAHVPAKVRGFVDRLVPALRKKFG